MKLNSSQYNSQLLISLFNSEEIWNENIVKVEIHNNPMYINYQNSQPSTSGYQPKSPQIERKV